MKKHWFLMVIFALIIFTSCKKENMIVGNWELISVEGVSGLTELCSGQITYNFLSEDDYYFMCDSVLIHHGWYSLQNNTINLEYFESIQSGSGGRISVSMKVSFSSSNKMIWKDNEIKYILKKNNDNLCPHIPKKENN